MNRAPDWRAGAVVSFRLALLFGIAVLGVRTIGAQTQCPAQAKLSLAQVLQLKDQLGESRALELVDSCRIDFAVDPSAVVRLSDANASIGILHALNRESTDVRTLEQARAEVAELKRTMLSRQKAAEDGRTAALQTLDASFRSEQQKISHIDPKGQFETTAEYNERLRRRDEALAELDRKHTSDREQLAARGVADATARGALMKAQVDLLENEVYPIPAVITPGHYNADTGLLSVRLGAADYVFEKVPTEVAKTLYQSWDKVKVEQPYTEDTLHTRVMKLDGTSIAVYGKSVAALNRIVTTADNTKWLTDANGLAARQSYADAIVLYNLVLKNDPSNQAALSGKDRAQAAMQQKMTLTQVRAETEQQRKIGVWVDPAAHLMWTLNDNGADIDWNGADAYCKAQRTGGFSNWRLATSDELKGIFDAASTRNTPPLTVAITYYPKGSKSYAPGTSTKAPEHTTWPYHIKGGIKLTGTEVWSTSTSAQSSANKMQWDFQDGDTYLNEPKTRVLHRALCVRPAI